ncbi:retropepsin-like aspartic protease family protein [Qipengyuania qiaonensis]|uniref:TIGR02281 family clan AA aspartic protease n=1 Tax=Qipengyuania qiaonensis TaxID=2867240 RepID=A0ABS7JE19_9SPHN|nr:TIGR02281 family clan AA aspartic protease [Qipengyuania qiaonensis]MBX7483928.1 TIGR02281 family clan AA aspartic protease [Qipengyuania qiaonensis]
MREALLLGIALVAFVGSAFVPGGAFDSATRGAQTLLGNDSGNTDHAPQPRKTEDVSYAAWVAGVTELPRAVDGHFYTEALVNGSQVNFLIDTGASVVALTGADARAAGLYWSDADVAPIARGASGPVFGINVALERVSLGGHEARNVNAIIVPEGLEISLLGQSFLSTVQPVRIEQDRMILGE